MKITMNFSLSDDDTSRYTDLSDLRSFYQQYGLSGLEVMPLMPDETHLLESDMITGVHACCITDWMELDQGFSQRQNGGPEQDGPEMGGMSM